MPPSSMQFLPLNRQADIAAKWCLVPAFLAFPISHSLASAFMLLILALWLLSGRWRERWLNLCKTPVFWSAMALYAMILLGVLYTVAPQADWQLHLEKYLKIALIAVWLSLFIDAPRHRTLALNAFVVAMLFIVVSTWLNIWFQLPWSKSQNQGWGVSHHVFGDHITQNVMMAFFVLVTLFRWRNSEKIWVRWLWFLVAIFSIISVTHLSEGRTGFVLLSAMVGVFVLLQIRGKLSISYLLLAAIVMIGLLASSEAMRDRFSMAVTEFQRSDVDNMTSIGHRLYNYKTTPILVSESPIIGLGTGAYHSQICRVISDPNQCQMFSWHPHNQYLFFAVNHGVIGLVLYFIFLGSMALIALRSIDKQAQILLLGLTVLLAINSLFNSPLWSSRESHFFTLMAGLLTSMAWCSRGRQFKEGGDQTR